MLFESSMLLYPLRACQHCNKTLANSSCCPHSHSSFLNWGVGVYKTWVLIPNRVIRKRKEAKNRQQSVSSWQALYAWRKSYQIGLYILAASFHTLAYSPPKDACILFCCYLSAWNESAVFCARKDELNKNLIHGTGILREEASWQRGLLSSLIILLEMNT